MAQAEALLKLACADGSFALLRPLEKAIALIALLDFEAVDLLVSERSHVPLPEVLHDPARAARRARAALRAAGLEVADVFLAPESHGTLAVNDPSPSARRDASAARDALLAFAAELGSPGVTVLPGIAWPGEPLSESLARALAELGVWVEHARAAGLRLSVEPHRWSVVPTPDLVLELLAAVDGLELTLDYSHFVFQGIPEREVEPLIPAARHLHVRGARPGRMHTQVGRSTIDIERVIDSLLSSGYAGYLGLEFEYVPAEREDSDPHDVLTETILLRDRILEKLAGRPRRVGTATL
jgi:sugar phosphate isomerase/epimerase